MKNLKTSLFLFLILFTFPAIGATAPITFTFEFASADIHINSTFYNNMALTIVATADTSGVYNPISTEFAINYSSLELTITTTLSIKSH